MISVPSDLILQLLTAGHDIAQDLANAMWPWLWVFLGVSFVGIALAATIHWVSNSWNDGFSNAPFGISYKVPDIKFSGLPGTKSKFVDHVAPFASFLTGSGKEAVSTPKRYEFVHSYVGFQPNAQFTYKKDIRVHGGLKSTKTYDNLDKPNTPQDYEHDGWIRDARTGNKLYHDPNWKPKTSTKA